MRIVDRKTFLAMPAGTVFSKYEPCVFYDLCIKGDTLPTNDFLVQQVHDSIECAGHEDFVAQLSDAKKLGASLSMDFYSQSRDGCFDGDDVLFAVWESLDVRSLITRLCDALLDSKE